MSMTRLGFWLLFFGALAFALPYFGVQHRVFILLGDAAAPVAIGLIVVGAALVVMGRQRARAKAAAAQDTTPKP